MANVSKSAVLKAMHKIQFNRNVSKSYRNEIFGMRYVATHSNHIVTKGLSAPNTTTSNRVNTGEVNGDDAIVG